MPSLAKTIDDPVLTRFRAEVDALYGRRLERVVLYRSRARGEAGPESDYDVAVFLEGLDDWWGECGRLSEIQARINLDFHEFVHAMPWQARSYGARTPLMNEIRADGIDF